MTDKFEQNAADLGLANAADPKGAEYDLVTSLLAAADFRSTENAVTEVEIRRAGKFYFAVHVHPISEDDVRVARKKATTHMRNPQGAKYPQIEKDFNPCLFNSWLIYLATTPEDQQKIWGNKSVKDKFGLMENVESIDVLLLLGEKTALSDKIIEISGLDDEEQFDAEDYAKK